MPPPSKTTPILATAEILSGLFDTRPAGFDEQKNVAGIVRLLERYHNELAHTFTEIDPACMAADIEALQNIKASLRTILESSVFEEKVVGITKKIGNQLARLEKRSTWQINSANFAGDRVPKAVKRGGRPDRQRRKPTRRK